MAVWRGPDGNALVCWRWALGVGDLSSVMRMCHGGWSVSSIWLQRV